MKNENKIRKLYQVSLMIFSSLSLITWVYFRWWLLTTILILLMLYEHHRNPNWLGETRKKEHQVFMKICMYLILLMVLATTIYTKFN